MAEYPSSNEFTFKGREDTLTGFDHFNLLDSGVDLLDTFKKLQQGPSLYVVYPNDLEKNIVHKCIILTRKHKWGSDGHGNENRYIEFPAIATKTGVFYGKQDMYNGKPFVMMFPAISFLDMFNMAGGINFHFLMDRIYKESGEFPCFEIHFYKKTKRRYRLTYLAQVDEDGRDIDDKGRPVYHFTHVRKIWEDVHLEKRIRK